MSAATFWQSLKSQVSSLKSQVSSLKSHHCRNFAALVDGLRLRGYSAVSS